MGVLTDFFIANDDDLSKLDDDGFLPAQEFETFQAKGADTIKVDILYALVLNRSDDEAVNVAELVHTGGDEGPWTFRLPQELVEALAGLNEDRFDGIGASCLKQEDFDGWEVEDVRWLLGELVKISQRSLARSARLFLWVCL